MEYIGEHLWAGNLGRLAVILAFTSAVLSSVAYYFFNKTEDLSWKKLARSAYYLHAASVMTIVGTLFYMMANHYFEYDYVWKHTSLDLPGRFLFSAFWEGQEGSFLLWMFWHSILGLFLMHTSKTWESKTLPVLSAVQAMLATMVMGVYVFGAKVGSSPFILIRQLEENVGAPWTEWTDYLAKFPAFMDGNGLNPLLQNYWMTIHPPTLFLGFALVIIPFTFAVAGLLTKDHKGWIKPAMPWAILCVSILGTGVLMGGAWAYEALSFGGFWAWDPVENSSLVPWLTLLAAMHLMIIQRNRGSVLVATYFFTIISFSFVLYSTFLTRSGALGDTSVHAFVDLGLNTQLMILLLLFAVGPLVIFAFRYKSIPKSKKDENMSSREFWMFVGALILLISAVQITFSTSLPIWNKWIGPDGVLPLFDDEIALQNPIDHYNSIQVPFAIVITFLMAITHFLSYKNTASSIIWKRTGLSIILSLVIAIIASISLDFYSENGNSAVYLILLFGGTYAVIANIDYWLRIMKGSLRVAGSSIAHIGFGLIIVGALISNFKKEIISSNTVFIHDEFPANENLLIELDDTVQMSSYMVKWVKERHEGNYRFYDLDFQRYDENNQLVEEFSLNPSILRSDKMDMNSSEPSTKHYFNKDIYTYVSYADLDAKEPTDDGWSNKWEFEIKQGTEMVLYDVCMIRLDTMVYQADMNEDETDLNKLAMGLRLTLIDMKGKEYEAIPLYLLENNVESHIDATIDELGIKIRFEGINTKNSQMIIHTWQDEEEEKPFIIIQAIVFPHINILWLGCFVMGLGTLIAFAQKLKKN